MTFNRLNRITVRICKMRGERDTKRETKIHHIFARGLFVA